MSKASARQGREVEAEITINAPVEAVWKALTDAEELTRWFPIQAEVTPGEGGRQWLSWGEELAGESRIEIWEPHRHLRTVAPEQPWSAEAGEVAPLRIAVDFYLEGRGGMTVLRLVHSGFGEGADWDTEYESVRSGWQLELRGLRHYLERHHGTPRRVAWVEWTVPFSKEEAWKKLAAMAPPLPTAKWKEGDAYRVEAVTGDVFAGVVQNLDPPKGFSGTIESLNGSLLRLLAEKLGGETSVWFWLSAYGVGEAELRGFEERWAAALGKAFPEGKRLRRLPA
jgi:uncharacterized protein YndB with AHSA1/START domain